MTVIKPMVKINKGVPSPYLLNPLLLEVEIISDFVR